MVAFLKDIRYLKIYSKYYGIHFNYLKEKTEINKYIGTKNFHDTATVKKVSQKRIKATEGTTTSTIPTTIFRRHTDTLTCLVQSI